MNSEIVKKRLDEVIENDATAESTEDFFATHVPVDQLLLLDKYEFQPALDHVTATEEEVFEKYIRNPNNKHQFIAVYGEAGTGKSHLIRWFKEKFEKVKSSDEVVLFLSRSDNSLKGTIKQLLGKKEVQDLENRELYDRLTSASSSIEPQKLKDTIYHYFIVEVEHDLDKTNGGNTNIQHDVNLNIITKKRLPAFLSNETVRNYMLRDGGPIFRIFSKVAEQAIVDLDIEAKFYPEDLILPRELSDELLGNGADKKAEKMCKKLMADEGGYELASNIAQYLNDFVDSVIQTSAGIEPADFEMLFMNIREQLYDLGKNLTVFIEDITSTTGVNKALLSALMTEHNSVQGRNVCRISSVIGSTSGYFQSDIRDNYQQRVTKYVYIPTGVFENNNSEENNRIYEFVGKYLNALSLEKEVLTEWVDNGALQSQYPVHKVKEGKNWDYYQMDDQKLCLYPFTKKAIINLYNTRLTQKTPRYIIKEMIKPVVSDILYHLDSFPDGKYKYTNILDSSFNKAFTNAKLYKTELGNRLSAFVYIWGDPKKGKGNNTLFGINEQCYTDIKLPIDQIKNEVDVNDSDNIDYKSEAETEYVSEVIKEDEITPIVKAEKKISYIDDEQQSKVNRANNYLSKWLNGGKINISATSGDSGIINAALKSIKDFVVGAINWQIDGLSIDIRQKIINGNPLVTLKNVSTETRGLYKLESNMESAYLILAFVKYNCYGKGSWNYDDSYSDCYIATSWFLRNKEEIIAKIKNEEAYKYDYSDYAIAFEIYKSILYGSLSVSDLNELKPIDFFKNTNDVKLDNKHGAAWKDTIKWIDSDNRGKESRTIVQDTFNIRQGVKQQNKVVIDYPRLEEAIKRVIKLLDSNEFSQFIPDKDTIGKRLDICKTYESLNKKIKKVLSEELIKINNCSKVLCKVFNIDEDEEVNEDDIHNLLKKIENFYKNVDEVKIRLKYEKKAYDEKKIKKAIDTINKIACEGNSLKSLVYLSSDPIDSISDFYTLIINLNDSFKRVDEVIGNDNISEKIEEDDIYQYSLENNIIDNGLKILENLEMDNDAN